MSYILPILVLLIGLGFFVSGRFKDNEKLKYIGIGILLSYAILEIPDFIKGIIDGYNSN